ncbi:MarR family winged helix-turn-helix transcriptional regulator [Bacillus marasmi]|uniref:MarR family winged helix-turn-helix transcriptional regulator n=1 Tax=Bacillus marasmi TaxID=1926279 RepID=UPI001FEBDF3A|nr:MarR family transcriptional regulator [Bacillus marasmi]
MITISDNKKELVEELLTTLRQFPKIFSQRTNVGQKRSEIMVLVCINKSAEGEMKVSEISNRLHVKAPTVTQLVNELEAKGQVERITRSTDRRSVWIRMTDEGKTVLKKVEKEIQITYSGLIDHLGEQETIDFIHTLKKMQDYFLDQMKKGQQE